MTHAIQQTQPTALAGIDQNTMTSLMAGGDCKELTPAQRNAYYVARCEAAGLDPRAQPFQFTNLNGKLVLYATKSATDQLAGKHGVVCTIVSQETIDGIRVVTVRATSKDGRSQEDIGAVNIGGLKGDALCNALMKAVTKAKRRTILSLCGLGLLDETELETVPHSEPVRAAPVVKEVRQARAVVEAVAERAPEPGPLDPGVDPPSMDAAPLFEDDAKDDEEWSQVDAFKTRIGTVRTMGQLLIIAAELKKAPPEVRDALRSAYAERRDELTKKAGGEEA